MSHFEKNEKFSMTSGVNFFKHGFIFEVKAKSPRENLQNYISDVYTQGFFSNFKNKAVFEKVDTAYHAKLFNFLKM